MALRMLSETTITRVSVGLHDVAGGSYSGTAPHIWNWILRPSTRTAPWPASDIGTDSSTAFPFSMTPLVCASGTGNTTASPFGGCASTGQTNGTSATTTSSWVTWSGSANAT